MRVVLALATLMLPARAGDLLTITPVRDDSLLVNPGKGWVEYDVPSQAAADLVAIGYWRPSWAVIEPAEGQYNWAVFDQFIDRWTKVGKRCALAVINFDGGMGKTYSIPKWVFDAGAEAVPQPDDSTPTKTIMLPKTWDDPVYLAKMKAFIRAFGARYDGSPGLAFVDIRDFGNSGECNGNYGTIRNCSAASFRDNFIQPYIDAFPHTQLMLPWTAAWFDGKSPQPIYQWATERGVGIRRDGICSRWSKDASETAPAYGHAPVVLEYAADWRETVKAGDDSPDTLMRYVTSGRPSYLQYHREFFRAQPEFCRMLGNKLGYHFVLTQAGLPQGFTAGGAVPLELTWLNDGVAPLYEPCRVAAALLDKDGKVVARQWLDGSNPKAWLPDTPVTEHLTVRFDTVPAGSRLAIGLFWHDGDAAPAYRLGIAGRTAGGWYVLTDAAEPRVAATRRPANDG